MNDRKLRHSKQTGYYIMFTVRLHRDLHKDIKKSAIDRNMLLKDWLTMVCMDFLERERRFETYPSLYTEDMKKI